MDKSHFIAFSSRPYNSRLQEINVDGSVFSSKQLAFNMQAQTQTNWCWAATATSVSHFYSSISNWTQCKLASEELEQSDCCSTPVPAPCDLPWYLEKALTRTDNFVNLMSGSAAFQQVCDEINAGRPVGVRIGWRGEGGHFLVIYGYSLIDNTEYYDIDDPTYGKIHLTASELSSNYLGFGTWTHTYLTKRELEMPIKYLIPDEVVIKRVMEVRPLLNLKQNTLFSSSLVQEQEASLGMSHRVFSLSLDSLLNNKIPLLQPTSMRVYEMVGENPRAFFDLSENQDPKIMQMSASSTHLNLFMQCLDKALHRIKKTGGECELRLLRIPALNFEAVWINYDDNAKDFILPLRKHGELPACTPIPMTRALSKLKKSAISLGSMDDSMGS